MFLVGEEGHNIHACKGNLLEGKAAISQEIGPLKEKKSRKIVPMSSSSEMSISKMKISHMVLRSCTGSLMISLKHD